MSELPYFVAQSNSIFAPAGADPQAFTLDFSLQAMLETTGPVGGAGWGGGLGAIIVLEGGIGAYPAKFASGARLIAPGPTEQAENGLTVVKLEAGGALQVPGKVTGQGVSQGTIRGRRGTTGRSGGAAGASGDGGQLPPPTAGGGWTGVGV